MNGSETVLYPGEVIDQLGYHGLKIIQNAQKFKFTIDAFLLAGFVVPKPQHRIIDLGTGNGVLPLLFAGQDKVQEILAVEIQPELADMASRSVILNELQNQIRVIQGDIREFPGITQFNSFDHVISNPPYYPVTQGVISENPALAAAKFEVNCKLDELIKTASRLVRGNGRVSLIYPSERLGELIHVLYRYHLTPKRLCFIHVKPGFGSNLLLLEARPGAREGMKILPPLFIYNQNGEYSELMNRIFHGMKL